MPRASTRAILPRARAPPGKARFHVRACVKAPVRSRETLKIGVGAFVSLLVGVAWLSIVTTWPSDDAQAGIGYLLVTFYAVVALIIIWLVVYALVRRKRATAVAATHERVGGEAYAIDRWGIPFGKYRIAIAGAAGSPVLEARARSFRLTHTFDFVGADARHESMFHVIAFDLLHPKHDSGDFAIRLPDSTELGRLRRRPAPPFRAKWAWSVLDPDLTEIGHVRERSQRNRLQRAFFPSLRLRADVVQQDRVIARIDQSRLFPPRYLLELCDLAGGLDPRLALALVVVLDGVDR